MAFATINITIENGNDQPVLFNSLPTYVYRPPAISEELVHSDGDLITDLHVEDLDGFGEVVTITSIEPDVLYGTPPTAPFYVVYESGEVREYHYELVA